VTINPQSAVLTAEPEEDLRKLKDFKPVVVEEVRKERESSQNRIQMDTLLNFKDGLWGFFKNRPSNPLDPSTDFEKDIEKCLRLSAVEKPKEEPSEKLKKIKARIQCSCKME